MTKISGFGQKTKNPQKNFSEDFLNLFFQFVQNNAFLSLHL
jgi:hypothetical protein